MDNSVYSVIEVMPKVQEYERRLLSLNRQLNKTTLTGKISNLQVAETLFEFMEETSEKFSKLQQDLVRTVIEESVKKIILEASTKAKICIEILIRNLYERTADVGFLATDKEISTFMSAHNSSDEEYSEIKERLDEYIKKYSIYSDAILLGADGRVKINNNPNNKIPIEENFSDIIQSIESSTENFTEYFGYSKLVPEAENSLLFMQKITDGHEDSGKTNGVLVLVFKFDDELTEIFKILDNNNHKPVILLLDKEGKTIASNNESEVPLGKKFEPLSDEEFKIITYNNKRYIVSSAKAEGYQDYYGTQWYSHVLIPIKDSLNPEISMSDDVDTSILKNSNLLSDELNEIKENSEEIEEDLVDTIINGELIASKTKAYSLNPVLENIRNISSDISEVVNASIHDIHQTIADAILSDVEFLATLAVDLMDRNLYERANNCRWWALNPELRDILSKEDISQHDQERMEKILEYLNSLYTVYENIFVFDKHGKVIAISNPNYQILLGQRLHNSAIDSTLRNSDSQKYFVSGFDKTELYADKPTYTYYASITQKGNGRKAIGGIGLVFNSEPEFKEMLKNSLPLEIELDEKKTKNSDETKANSFGVFADREGKIIATSNKQIDAQKACQMDESYLSLAKGEKKSGVITFDGVTYTVGCRASSGYREYKNGDGYNNDILSFVFIKI